MNVLEGCIFIHGLAYRDVLGPLARITKMKNEEKRGESGALEKF